MTDRKKVIKALELEIKYKDTWQCALDCPYYGNTGCNCYTQVAMDALELLREQEPIEPEEIINDKYPVGDINRCCGWRCGKCKETIPGDADFCPNCGRAVRWDG